MRLRPIIAVLSAVALCVPALPAVAGASSEHGVTDMLGQPASHSYSFSSTCPSTTVCYSAGNRRTSSDALRPLVYRYDRAKKVWTYRTLPLPASAVSGFLYDLSCPTAYTCFAVGTYIVKQGSGYLDRPLLEHLAHGAWSASTPKLPSGTTVGVARMISCPTTTMCAFYGRRQLSDKSYRSYVGTIHRSTVSVTSVVRPANAHGFSLDDLSCGSTHECVALAAYTDENGLHPQIGSVVWTGSSWRTLLVPIPKGGRHRAFAQSVSCGSSNCVAVGDYSADAPRPAPEYPMISTFNGKSWSSIRGPLPKAYLDGTSLESYSESVSCVAASCEAIGRVIIGGGGTRSFIQRRRTGTSSWTVSSVEKTVQLVGVSCGAHLRCGMTGFQKTSGRYPELAVLDRDGTLFTQQVPPPSNAQSEYPLLSTPGCAPNGYFCVSVGSGGNGSDNDDVTTLVTFF